MSVFTTVTPEQMRDWLRQRDVGQLIALEGIASGIENTNYFVTTDRGRFVLTLFEKLRADELPFFLDLLAHLAAHGVPCPGPVPDRDGRTLGVLNGKPACLAVCLPGASVTAPQPVHCARIGDVLARLHLAAAGYPQRRDNPRAEPWWSAAAPRLAPFLTPEDRRMLTDEIEFQAQADRSGLPSGVIHADLFCDNALFDGDRLGGVIDFYFACTEYWLYDLAIAANDWCTAPGGLDPARLAALLDAYHAVRPLTPAERGQWSAMLRRAALRFWVSRLEDLHFPRAGEMTFAKDPAHFGRMLAGYRHDVAGNAVWPEDVR